MQDVKTDTNVPLICEETAGNDKLVDSVVRNVTWQMDIDRKAKALKQLQGHIWSHAYKNG